MRKQYILINPGSLSTRHCEEGLVSASEPDPTKQSRTLTEGNRRQNPHRSMRWIIAIVLACILAGCETLVQNTFQPQIVVQAYLYANEPLDSLVLRKTVSLSSINENDYLGGATVTISDGSNTYSLISYDSAHPGRYRVEPIGSFVPLPGHTYNLRVAALGTVATAQTTIPDTLRIDSAKVFGRVLRLSGDSLWYPGTPQNTDSLLLEGPHIWWSTSPKAASYAIETLALNSNADTTWPIKGETVQDSSAMGRYRFLILSTNEQIPWEQFRRFGPNVIRVLAIDKNYQDFILSVFASSSQFDNNTLHITNGLGVFGSAARGSMYVYLD